MANAAVKEEQIEVKLAAIESDWAAFDLVGAFGRQGDCIAAKGD